MTAAIFRNGTPSLSVPPTQNTAPVLEFACLYTHDIRKKSKKWQDGFLRYHTFNKRAMVYDVPRNFIGDMHWTGDCDLAEGDEVTLEKAGVRVEVAERIGVTETDLSELRPKKGAAEPKRMVERSEFGATAAATPIARAPTAVPSRGTTQLKHRSLNALLGTPKGPIGKASLPTKSPFEERHANVENEEWEEGRPAKKARVAETRTLKQREMPPWARTADRQAGQQQEQPVFIDLSDDVTPSNQFLPGFSSDALAPSSPAKAAAPRVSRRSSSPAHQLRRQPDNPGPVAKRKEAAAPRLDPAHHNREPDSVSRPNKSRKSPEPAVQPAPLPSRSASSKPGQTLRLAASGPKKRTLLCQDQLTKKPQRPASMTTSLAGVEEPTAVVHDKDRPKKAQDRVRERLERIEHNKDEDRPKTAQDRVRERLERIERNKARTLHVQGMSSTTVRNDLLVNVDSDGILEDPISNAAERGPQSAEPSHDSAGGHKQRPRTAVQEKSDKYIAKPIARPRTALDRPDTSRVPPESAVSNHSEDFGHRSSHETSAIELARLDRMMLPPAAPRRAPTPPAPVPAPRDERPLRRVVSEPPKRPETKPAPSNQPKATSKRVPGAPVRYTPTPSPTKRSREPTPVPPVERAPFKNKKKVLQKSVSLNMTAAGTSTVILGRPFQAPGKPSITSTKKVETPPEDVGPWSREAFDLFKWRPPGWDEEKWCIVEQTTAPAVA